MTTPPFATRTHTDMQDVLMDPGASGPDIHYYMIRGGSEKKNVTIWDSGTVGKEYIKAYGHYHKQALGETYTIVHGQGILLMQKRALDSQGVPIDDHIESCRAIFLTAPQTFFIPPGFGHLLVNIGATWLVSIDDSPVNLHTETGVENPEHADYAPMKKLRGFAYYVVNENNVPVFVKNEQYAHVPALSIET